MTALTYRTFEVRVVADPAAHEAMHDAAFAGCRAQLTASPWQILPGPPQRVDVAPRDWDGEKLVGYAWPIAADSDHLQLASGADHG